MRNVRCIKSVFLLIIVLALGCAVESAHADITIPSGVTSIEDEAFYGDTAVTGVILPDTVQTIGELAFADSGLQTITLPASLSSIANTAFQGTNVNASVAPCSYASRFCSSNNIPRTALQTGKQLESGRLYIRHDMHVGQKLSIDVYNRQPASADVWIESSDPQVLSVNEFGEAEAVSCGTATLRVMSGTTGYYSWEVSVWPVFERVTYSGPDSELPTHYSRIDKGISIMPDANAGEGLGYT